MRKVRRIAGNTIILCLIGIMFVSMWDIYADNYTYKKAKQVYAELPSKDFKGLSAINPDVVGWLSCDNGIDYPVVQGEDNDKYLDTLFDGSEGDAGAIFVDHICKEPFKQFNTVVYGHHMFNGAMFGKLKKYRGQEYAKNHPFELYTKDNLYDLRVCAFMNPASTDLVYSTNLKESERKEYIKHIEEEAEYCEDISIKDTLVILSTCAYEYEGARYVVVCKATPRPRELITVEVEPTDEERQRAAWKKLWKNIREVYLVIFQ